MNKKRLIGSIVPALTAFTLCTTANYSVSAFDAPSNIEVAIGTVELNKEDLQGDTVVDVPVYIRNNPGFLALNLVYELDPRLSYDDKLIELACEDVSGVSMYRCSGTDKALCTDIMSLGSEILTGDRQLISLKVVVPGNLDVGRYPIRFTSSYADGKVSILVEDSFDASFGIECFSKFEDGAVVIKTADVPDPTTPPPPPPQEVQETQAQNNEPAPVQNTEPATASVTEASKETTQQTSSSASTSKTTVSTSKKTSKDSTTVKTETETSSETSETMSTAETTQISLAAEITEEKEQNDKRERTKILAAVIAAAAAVSGTATGLIIKKKRGNSHE